MQAPTSEFIDIGAWIGRQQAFALIGSKCSAAQAQCLREIRESRAYEKLDLTWDDFCPAYAAISRSKADDLIRRLDEFGEAYFRIAEVIRISPEAYRQIAPHVQGESIQLSGESVPLVPENAPRIRLAIRSLLADISRLDQDQRRRNSTVELSDRLDNLLGDIHRRIDERLVPEGERASLRGLATSAVDRFRRLARVLDALNRP